MAKLAVSVSIKPDQSLKVNSRRDLREVYRWQCMRHVTAQHLYKLSSISAHGQSLGISQAARPDTHFIKECPYKECPLSLFPESVE